MFPSTLKATWLHAAVAAFLPICTALFARRSGPRAVIGATTTMQALSLILNPLSWIGPVQSLAHLALVHLAVRRVVGSPRYASSRAPLESGRRIEPGRDIHRPWWVTAILAIGMTASAIMLYHYIPIMEPTQNAIMWFIYIAALTLMSLPALLGLALLGSWSIANRFHKMADPKSGKN